MESNSRSSDGNRRPAQTFRDLVVWQKAHDFVLCIYKMTSQFPKEERFCLTSQFRRAAISLAANIAEGFSRKTNAEKLRFYNVSQGSLEECRYYLILSKDLAYHVDSENVIKAEVTSKLLTALIKSIERGGRKG
jgi:four helix bundle protein